MYGLGANIHVAEICFQTRIEVIDVPKGTYSSRISHLATKGNSLKSTVGPTVC